VVPGAGPRHRVRGLSLPSPRFPDAHPRAYRTRAPTLPRRGHRYRAGMEKPGNPAGENTSRRLEHGRGGPWRSPRLSTELFRRTGAGTGGTAPGVRPDFPCPPVRLASSARVVGGSRAGPQAVPARRTSPPASWLAEASRPSARRSGRYAASAAWSGDRVAERAALRVASPRMALRRAATSSEIARSHRHASLWTSAHVEPDNRGEQGFGEAVFAHGYGGPREAAFRELRRVRSSRGPPGPRWPASPPTRSRSPR
jgi:hypothetical protein